MRKILLFLIPVLFASCLGEKEMKTSVEEQANQFGDDLRRDLLERYLDRMAHFVYSNKEERAELKKRLEEKNAVLRERGNQIVKVESYLDSEILENDGYYQCIVRQSMLMSNNNTTHKMDTYLLAVSKDGEEWKFADVTSLTNRLVKVVFPEMHPAINVEKRDQPE